MRHPFASLCVGGIATLLNAVFAVCGCSTDQGDDIRSSDSTARAVTARPAGSSNGMEGSGGGPGGAGNGGSGAATPPAMNTTLVTCTPVFLDADVALDAGADAGDAGPYVSNGPVSFATDIHPFLQTNCGPCHTTDGNGGHNVASPDEAEAYGFAKNLGERILERVNGGGMPPTCGGAPGDPGCLSVAAVDLIRRWTAQCFPP